MDGRVAQWFGLSFQRHIQSSMTLFFELRILFFKNVLFSALIFFMKYCHYFGVQGSNFGLWLGV